MKKVILIFCVLGMIIFSAGLFLNMRVTTRKCVNFKCGIVEMPLFLKLLDFYDRHYNYHNLLRTVIPSSATPQEKAMAIFIWTHNNIKRLPDGYPVIDDHVWHIIVRGYGVQDQSADVFVTLCNYSGLDAFYRVIYSKDRQNEIILSFVRFEDGFAVFDTYNGNYFKNNRGSFASVDDIKNNNWIVSAFRSSPQVDYGRFFESLPADVGSGFSRGKWQHPFNRLIFEVRRWLRIV